MLHARPLRRVRRGWLQGAATMAVIVAVGLLPATPVFSQSPSTVALIIGIKGDPFYITMGKGAQAEADKMGVNLIVDGPSTAGDTVGQTAMVDAMIARKVDAIMIAAVDKQSMIQPL